jgi:hypothetical protein
METSFSGIPINKLNQGMESERGEPPEPPPSCGTALTFSDVTEYTIADSEYTFGSRAHTRYVNNNNNNTNTVKPVKMDT